jgi:hypothetical protein
VTTSVSWPLGRYGFIQALAFLISGLAAIGLAYVIRELTRGSRGSFLGSLLIGIYGLAGLVVGIFPTDRIDSKADIMTQSTTGWVHLQSVKSSPGRTHARMPEDYASVPGVVANK